MVGKVVIGFWFWFWFWFWGNMIDVGWPMLLSLAQPSVLPKDGVILLFSFSSYPGQVFLDCPRGCEIVKSWVFLRFSPFEP